MFMAFCISNIARLANSMSDLAGNCIHSMSMMGANLFFDRWTSALRWWPMVSFLTPHSRQLWPWMRTRCRFEFAQGCHMHDVIQAQVIKVANLTCKALARCDPAPRKHGYLQLRHQLVCHPMDGMMSAFTLSSVFDCLPFGQASTYA